MESTYLSFMGERKRKKKHVGGKKEKKKKIRAFATPKTRTPALHAFPAFQFNTYL